MSYDQVIIPNKKKTYGTIVAVILLALIAIRGVIKEAIYEAKLEAAAREHKTVQK